MCVYGQGAAYECMCVQRPEASECELERQVAVSHSTELLETKLRTSARAWCAPTCWAVSPAQEIVPSGVKKSGSRSAMVALPWEGYRARGPWLSDYSAAMTKNHKLGFYCPPSHLYLSTVHSKVYCLASQYLCSFCGLSWCSINCISLLYDTF
jgi:hypothetical protein